ncbi:MAG: NAD(+)/NADH kinase [Defluviitaleaceae bacterium]|nr:NAD(+)/NADH kinase [Defluviitaleaceae bacterium]
MKKIGIIANETRDINYEYRDYILSSLPEINFLLPGQNLEQFIKNCDICIVLGGDGTILNYARLCARYETYIHGINLGSVGYLTDVSKENGIEAIKNLLAGNFIKEDRMMLKCEDHIALNDICIVKGSYAKMISLELSINGEYVDSYKADGIIISTPTGSTAYNLGAGGPILEPLLDNIIITPIAPYRLLNRPIVLSANSEIKVKAANSELVVDGVNVFCAEEYTVKKSAHSVGILRTQKTNFYNIMKEKFSI